MLALRTLPPPRHRARQAVLDDILGDRLQAQVSTAPAMPEEGSHPIAAARHPPFPLAVRHRMAGFTGSLQECFTAATALTLVPLQPARNRLVASIRQHRQPDRLRFRYFRDAHSIAPETDTTAVCLIGLWRSGSLTAEELREGARQLLMAAATEDHPDEGLTAGVVKTYWEDHPDAPVRRRGRRLCPVTACNALRAVLLAWRLAGLRLEEPVPLIEHRADGSRSEATLTGSAILSASLTWLARHLAVPSPYYPSTATLLAAAAQVAVLGGERTGWLIVPLRDGLHRWLMHPPDCPLALAEGLIAADTLGLIAPPMLRQRLLDAQQPGGHWPAAAHYRLRTQPLFFGSPALTTLTAMRAVWGPRW